LVTIEAMPFARPASVTKAYHRVRQLSQPDSARRLPPRKRVLLVAFMAKQGAGAVSPSLCRAFNTTVGPNDRYKDWRNAARDYREETRSRPKAPGTTKSKTQRSNRRATT
jgi:hypothetical protein